MNEKDVTFKELIEILNRVKYYCKNKGTCFDCALRNKHCSLGENNCMLYGIPCYWKIDEREETK